MSERLQILQKDGDPIFPACSLAGTSDKQLKGNFGSDINSDSQVPLIQTDIACELGLINFEKSQLTHERQGCGKATRMFTGMCEMCGLMNHADNTDACMNYRAWHLPFRKLLFAICRRGDGRAREELGHFSFFSPEKLEHHSLQATAGTGVRVPQIPGPMTQSCLLC